MFLSLVSVYTVTFRFTGSLADCCSTKKRTNVISRSQKMLPQNLVGLVDFFEHFPFT